MKRIVANRKTGEAVVHISGVAGVVETIAITGAGSDIDEDTGIAGDETVTGASINSVTWGSGGAAIGVWKVTRAGNTILILSNSGSIDFGAMGQAITLDNASDIVCTLNGATEGFLTLELQKKSTITNDQYLR